MSVRSFAPNRVFRLLPVVVGVVYWCESVSAQLPEGFPPPSDPETTLEGIRLSDSRLEVSLYAAEPLVRDPIAMAWDEAGRLYVVEMADYPLGPPNGRIRVLRDTDNDGVPDRSTVFASGIGFPTGIFPWRGGVFVTAAPNILYLRDRDGDDRADERRVVFSGFVEGNQQHRVNGLIWGPDGWIWGANGDSGGRIFRPEATENRVSINGSDFRFDPLTLAFEAVAGQSQYGHTFDQFGHRFTCNNSDHIRLVVFSRSCLELNPYIRIPFVQLSIAEHGGKGAVYPISPQGPRFNMPLDLGRFSAACSVYVYRGGSLPADYRGNSFTCDAVANIVHRDLLVWSDGRLVAKRAENEQKREFFAAADPWVRPVYITTGPDGALYVCDMYRAVIEHPEWIPDSIEQKLDLYAGSDRGRIYRIAPRGKKPTGWPRIRPDVRQLLSELCSENSWRRDTAYRLLVENHDTFERAVLERHLRTAFRQAGSGETRLLLLRVMVRLGLDGSQEAVALFGDPSARVRAAAFRLVAEKPDLVVEEELLRWLEQAVGDEDAEVRKEAACVLGRIGSAWNGRVADLLARILARDSADVIVRTAALLASHGREGSVLVRLIASQTERIDDLVYNELAYAAARRGQVEEVVHATTKLQTRGREGALLAVLAGLARAGARLDDSDTQGELLRRVRRWALNQDAPLPLRRRALESLRLWGPKAIAADAFRQLLSPDSAPELRSAAVELAWETGQRDLIAPLVEHWNEQTPALRKTLVRLYLSSVEGRRDLLEKARKGIIPPGELVSLWPEARRELADILHVKSRDAVLQQYRQALKLTGDRARGKMLFEKHCAKCHTVEGVGTNVGPDLLRVRKRDPEALLVDILDPNRAVDPAYINHVVVTKEGRVFQGIVIADTAASITLRAAEGEQQTIAREDIEAIRSSGQSLMPEGLEEELSIQDIADLIRYLREIQ